MDAGRGSASAMMSFHDFGHSFHRFGIMSFAEDARRGGREEKDPEETKGSATATATRAVFEDASSGGTWPGSGKVSPVCRVQLDSCLADGMLGCRLQNKKDGGEDG